MATVAPVATEEKKKRVLSPEAMARNRFLGFAMSQASQTWSAMSAEEKQIWLLAHPVDVDKPAVVKEETFQCSGHCVGKKNTGKPCEKMVKVKGGFCVLHTGQKVAVGV